MPTALRPMVASDAAPVARLWVAIWSEFARGFGEDERDVGEADLDARARRYHYLLGTDPGGSYVAVEGDELVGLAVSHVREDTFMLANLGVAPSFQGRGVGRALLEAALGHGASAARGLICSSPDPRALQRYLRAGFKAAPAMEVSGRVGVDPAPCRLRPSDGSPADLGAVDAALARRTLAALLSGAATGRACTARWLTESTPWAFEAAADARAHLRGHGAVMTRGAWPATRHVLPSGVFG